MQATGRTAPRSPVIPLLMGSKDATLRTCAEPRCPRRVITHTLIVAAIVGGTQTASDREPPQFTQVRLLGSVQSRLQPEPAWVGWKRGLGRSDRR